jgi:membrane carboxypeptidase/penicillin-binding protein PbpC
MPIRPDTRRLPTLRNILTRIYSDLFTIDDRLRWHDPVDPLLPVEKMILILEDRRFFRHNGVDLRSLCREIVRAVLIQPHGGASTIDMQFVRTATGFREKTFKR